MRSALLGLVIGCSSSTTSEVVTCPTTAVTSCPIGCESASIDRFAGDCLVPSGEVLCIPRGEHARCLGQVSCRRRESTIYRVPSACALDGFDFCAGAEDTKVLSAESCP